jgi:hypothetical protein
LITTIRSHRGISFIAVMLVALVGAGVASIWNPQAAASNQENGNGVVLNTRINMTCFPPPPPQGQQPGPRVHIA